MRGSDVGGLIGLVDHSVHSRFCAARAVESPARFAPVNAGQRPSDPPSLEPPTPSNPLAASPTRAIVLLSLAGFASQAMVRVSDSLLPQIAADLAVTVGAASIVVTAYGIAHGTVQLFGGRSATASANIAPARS